jgi:excisionase family DNA binding protein
MATVDRTKLMTIPEFAKEIGLSERTIHRYISEGIIDAYRLGPKALRIHRNQLDKLITKK